MKKLMMERGKRIEEDAVSLRVAVAYLRGWRGMVSTPPNVRKSHDCKLSAMSEWAERGGLREGGRQDGSREGIRPIWQRAISRRSLALPRPVT